ncbi:MAG: hypothetical protein LBU67_01320 [Oscillospiraceae bacterium]|jgi:alpha-mannosidase|nr:hypothetical protein [Oscillospiraceae bacterium]
MSLTLHKSSIDPNPAADQEHHRFTRALWPHLEGWRDGRCKPRARLCGCTNAMTGARRHRGLSFARAALCNLLEEGTAAAACEGPTISARLNPYQIVTLRIWAAADDKTTS